MTGPAVPPGGEGHTHPGDGRVGGVLVPEFGCPACDLAMRSAAMPPGGEELREALIEALRVDSYRPFWQRGREGIADLILPTVDAIARRRAAKELRAAADEFRARFGWGGGYGKQLRDRADELTDHEEGGPQPGAPSGTLTG